MSEATRLMTLEQAKSSLCEREFLKRRDDLLANSRIVDAINDDDGNETAGAIYSQLKDLSKSVEANRKAFTAPLDALKKQVMDYERSIIGEVESEIARVKGIMDDYATRKLNEQREAEARDEAERQRQITEQAIAEANGEAVTPEVLPPTPVPQNTARTSATTVQTAWDFEVVDKRQIPVEFLAVNDRAIVAALKMRKAMGLKPEEARIPGIRIFEVASTRKR